MEKDINAKLMNGFAKILDKKHSVTLLCEKSGVSRASFYLYYKDFEEFKKEISIYLTQKYFSQIGEFMFCDEEDLPTLLKNENLFFDETQRKLLAYFAEGKNYLSFSYNAYENALPEFMCFCKEKLGEEFYRENEYRIKYCINGIATLAFFNIVDYDEDKFIFEMTQSRKTIKKVLGR